MTSTVLVTGATGYIGSVVCDLLRSGDVPVVETRRHRSDNGFPQLDMDASSQPRELFDRVGTVVHLAGVAHRSATLSDIERINHDGTLRLAEAASESGVRQFIFVSSVHAAYVDDATPPQDAPYAVFKWRTEQALLELVGRTGMRVNIVRPALVYGGRMKGRLATLQSLARRGLLPRLPDVGAMPMISRADLARLILTMVSNRDMTGAVVTASDGEAYSLSRIADAFIASSGRQPLIPFGRAVGVAALGGLRVLRRIPGLANYLPLAKGIHPGRTIGEGRLALDGFDVRDTLEAVLSQGRRP